MKQFNISLLLTILMSMVGASVSAHDIEAVNAYGKIIYYVWNSNQTELTVSFNDEYSNKKSDRYTGNIDIPESVFYNGKSFRVTAIGYGAFEDCSGLIFVTIPNSVTVIGDYAFTGCSGLTSVTIPNSVTAIGGSAFAGCSGLTSIDIPNSVTAIGFSAFYHCSNLTSVTIGNSVTSIGDFAFGSCYSLTSVNIPNGVTSIGGWAFSSCYSLTSVTIGNSVTSIWDCAFQNCTNITKLVLNCKYIGNWFNDSKTKINDVTLCDDVEIIGEEAFMGFSALTSITIPNRVTSIEDYAFNNCYGLCDVYCYAEKLPSTGAEIFYGTNISNATLHVPAASIESYKSQEPWSSFKKIIGFVINRCATPNISYADGKLSFSCETEDVKYTYHVTYDYVNDGNADEVQLAAVCKVTVYASKEGYADSEVATIEIPVNAGGGLRGDLNDDSKVNALDIQEVINIASSEE